MPQSLFSKWHSWVIEKRSADYRVLIVEPLEYEPDKHKSVFHGVLEWILGERQPISSMRTRSGSTEVHSKYFDHLVFPEAFLKSSDFISSLRSIPLQSSLGCIHVGLRSESTSSHLFSNSEVRDLIAGLKGVPGLVEEDLEEFERWITLEHTGGYYNLACIFTYDVDSNLRVCIHPKVVRSKIENSFLKENCLTEANMCNLVVLHPEDNRHSITIQPLICSDVILRYDSSYGSPLKMVNRRERYKHAVPDQVDIVSIVSCTPQVAIPETKLETQERRWQPDFRDSFIKVKANGDYEKHWASTWLISNYQELRDKHGGLSGVFFPYSISDDNYLESFPDCHLDLWGNSTRGADQGWYLPEKRESKPDSESIKQDIKGFITAIKPIENWGNRYARVLAITISRMPSQYKPLMINEPKLNSHDIQDMES